MEIAPNVTWLDGGSSNFYLCQDEDGLTLIDSGMPGREGMVFDALLEMGRQPSDLVRILITHADLDHVGSAARVQAQSGATVHASPATAELISKGKSPKHMPWLIQFLIDHFMKYAPIPVSTIEHCQDGDVLPVLGGLHVLSTPGHTMDHHAYYSPAGGILFAGDALDTRGNHLNPSRRRIAADEDEARRSAIKLVELAPAVIACGHGPPKSDHGSDDLMEFFNELRQNA